MEKRFAWNWIKNEWTRDVNEHEATAVMSQKSESLTFFPKPALAIPESE